MITQETRVLHPEFMEEYIFRLIPHSMKYQPKFGKNWPEIKMLYLSPETMEADHC